MTLIGRRCTALLVGAVLTLSACDGGSDSPAPAPSTSARRSTAPALPVVSPGTTQGVPVAKVDQPRWTSVDKRVGQVRDSPIVDGIVILAGSEGIAAVTAGLVALSLRTGQVVWQKRFGDIRADLPRLDVAGASATRVLLAVGPSRYSSPAQPPGPRALALDTATGKIVWRRSGSIAGRLSGDTAVVVDLDEARVATSPATTVGTVVGLDARTARERWRLPGADHDADDISAPTDRTVVVDSSPSRLIDTTTGRVLWTSKNDPTCVSDDRLVVCASENHLISWSIADPVVRSSARTVDGSPRLLEDGRVHLDSSPAKIVDLSGSPRLTSLRTTMLAGGGGFLVVENDSAEGAVSVAAVSNGI